MSTLSLKVESLKLNPILFKYSLDSTLHKIDVEFGKPPLKEFGKSRYKCEPKKYESKQIQIK